MAKNWDTEAGPVIIRAARGEETHLPRDYGVFAVLMRLVAASDYFYRPATYRLEIVH